MNTSTTLTPIKSIGRCLSPRNQSVTPEVSPEPVYLVSLTTPRLADHPYGTDEFLGVYLGDDGAAHVRLPDHLARHLLPTWIATWSHQQVFALLAVILQMELDGQSEPFIQSAIFTLTNPEPQQLEAA